MLPMAISKMHVINGSAMLGFTEVNLLFTQLMTNVHHAHSILIPLEMMIERASLSIARWTSRSIGTIYKVQNKVFSITFWNKDEAEDFINKQCSTTNLHGFQVYPLEVFGDKEKWIRENVSPDMILKERNIPSIDCIRDPDAGIHGMGNVFGR
jgi:hypothetical protein